jgi:hypothetical protein
MFIGASVPTLWDIPTPTFLLSFPVSLKFITTVNVYPYKPANVLFGKDSLGHLLS